MNRVRVLDCTLRDGGYCNQWAFGFENIKKIISGLVQANIDIIECGFLTKKVQYNKNNTKFTDLSQISTILPGDKSDKSFVVMMNFGEYDASDLPKYNGGTVNGIRVAFHKKDVVKALEQCRLVKERGYEVYVQAMVSLKYSDEEFLDLIYRVNKLMPEAFYIVDSFGMMKHKDLLRLFSLVEHNLTEGIKIGFHSHNNMQLSFSNAQMLVDMQSRRDLIIDSSVYGMGRGAGNLNTELFIGYLNDNTDSKYDIRPILNIMDESISGFYQRNPWGYTLPNYLSALHNSHPNYAGFLNDKNTLTAEKINEIFEIMDEDKRPEFDRKYIDDLYLRYMEMGKTQNLHHDDLVSQLNGKEILLIGPAKSSYENKDEILQYIRLNSPLVMSVNFDYSYYNVDYIFVSNMRRFKELDCSRREKCIVSSNVPANGVYYQAKFADLVNDVDFVKDNAVLMAVKFLMSMDVEKISLAGFDGYSHDELENYAKEPFVYVTKKAILDAINDGMGKVLSDYSKQIEIKFVTQPKHFVLRQE